MVILTTLSDGIMTNPAFVDMNDFNIRTRFLGSFIDDCLPLSCRWRWCPVL